MGMSIGSLLMVGATLESMDVGQFKNWNAEEAEDNRYYILEWCDENDLAYVSEYYDCDPEDYTIGYTQRSCMDVTKENLMKLHDEALEDTVKFKELTGHMARMFSTPDVT